MNRLTRLTAILLRLQSGRLVTAASLTEMFGVSVRTIYRDMRTLEEAGVPLYAEEGKGYRLVQGYRLPPVMFTEREANALITADLLVKAANDSSLITDYAAAIAKLKAVLPERLQNSTEELEARTGVSRTFLSTSAKSDYLAVLQQAMVNYRVVSIDYTNLAQVASTRELEPFAVYSNRQDEWVMVAYCRLRKELRSFSISRISDLRLTGEVFEPHPMTFTDYLRKTYGN